MEIAIDKISKEMQKEFDITKREHLRKLDNDLNFIKKSYISKMELSLDIIREEYLYKMKKAINIIEGSYPIKKVIKFDDTYVTFIDNFDREKYLPCAEFISENRDSLIHILRFSDNIKIEKSLEEDIDVLTDALKSCENYERNKEKYDKIQMDLVIEFF